MLRVLCCLLLVAASALSAPIEGIWKLVSLDHDTRGTEMGTADFTEKTVSFRLSDGFRLTVPYSVTNGVLSGQSMGERRRLIVILRGRFDEERNSLTMALVVRNLDDIKANRSVKLNCIRVPESDDR